jgi:NAD(P)-dependent dehydrogenase (short-subunit alcohol dehydrogenase family)
MADKFAGKVAVITGGSTGIGLATAKRFVQEGMDHVFITGRRKDALDRAAAEIGRNVTAVQGDVASLTDLDRLYDEVRKQNRKLMSFSPMPALRNWRRLAPSTRSSTIFTSTPM